ncbi:OR6B1 protein, partial [Cisticola juncidis]|nr:OR6B1 protein [Cisticola juncidis]
MVQDNDTYIHEFILLGFPAIAELQTLLFVIFLAVYLLTVTENVVIIALVVTNPQLHKPMYFFLGHLAFLEACYISVTVPKLLVTLVASSKSISFAGCMAQLYFFIALVCTECVLTQAMAHPLPDKGCITFLPSILHTVNICIKPHNIGFFTSFISQLSFCGPRLAELVDFVAALFNLLIPLSVIVISYACIISTILFIPKAQNRRKAFSTCTSHLAVVVIFFSATLFMYARPRSANSRDLNKLVSIIYTIITPMLNPFIYCLRNQEVKDTLVKVLCSRAALSRVS